MLEEEGLRAAVLYAGEAVLGGPEQPKEGNDDEVDDVGVEGSEFRMVSVESVEELSQDERVDWIGARWRVVVVVEGLEESSE